MAIVKIPDNLTIIRPETADFLQHRFRVKDGVLQILAERRWWDLGQVTGPKGERGEKGDSITGPKGEDGESPVLEVDHENNRLRFSLRGLSGEWIVLPPGPIGPAGPAGRDSIVPGPRGEKGEKGDPGERGPRGSDAPPPRDGKDGNDGRPGRDAPIPRIEKDEKKGRFRFLIGDEVTEWIYPPKGKDGAPGRVVQGSGASGASNFVRWYTVTTDYTLERYPAHEGIKIDATDGDITVSVPDVAFYKNHVFFFKRVDSSNNTVTIQPTDGATIDGQECLVIGTRYQNRRISSDGTEWLII